jgi:outer membrane immunogenic protein
MRKILIAATIASIAGGSALAADDITVPAGYNWAGLYAGAVGSWQYGAFKYSERSVGAESLLGDLDGFVGGVTLGANRQVGNFVIGIEGDYSFGGMDGRALNGLVFNCVGGCDLEVDNFASLRARFGYAFDRSLIYGTAGWGFAEATASIAALGTLGEDRVRGPVWGGGLEYAFTEEMSAKIEYLHIDLGRLEIPTSCGSDCFTDIRYEAVRFGLNYRF